MLDELTAKLRAKGREVLLTLTLVGFLLSLALGPFGDALLILITGLVGWMLTDQKKDGAA